MPYHISRDTYKGYPLLVVRLNPEDKFPVISLGTRKAQALLDESVRAELAKFVSEAAPKPRPLADANAAAYVEAQGI